MTSGSKEWYVVVVMINAKEKKIDTGKTRKAIKKNFFFNWSYLGGRFFKPKQQLYVTGT